MTDEKHDINCPPDCAKLHNLTIARFLLGEISPTTLWRIRKKKKIQTCKVGGREFIRHDKIREYLSSENS